MSKKNRKRRRSLQQQVSWSAARAARSVVQAKVELVERYEHNPILRQMGAAHMGQVLDGAVQRLMQDGCSTLEAQKMAPVLITGHLVDPATPDLAAVLSDKTIQAESSSLRVADPFVVSPAMHAVTAAAAATVTMADLLTLASEEDVPSSDGVLLLPDVQLVQRGGSPELSELRTISWRLATGPAPDGTMARKLHSTGWIATDGPLQFPEFTAARRIAKEQGHPFPGMIPDSRRLVRIDHDHELSDEVLREVSEEGSSFHVDVDQTIPRDASGDMVGEYTGEVIDDPSADFELRYLFAFWRLCAQRIAVGADRRDLESDGVPTTPEVDEVRVIQLRTFTPYEEDPDHQHGHRNYRHRWVVRMHKVRQWHPKQGVHKIIWRGPYIKGPEGAPLLEGEKVHALIR